MLTNGKCDRCQAVFLNDDSSNNHILSPNYGKAPAVFLSGRTLYKDGSWNTLCLPFNITDFTGTILENATVKELSSASFNIHKYLP